MKKIQSQKYVVIICLILTTSICILLGMAICGKLADDSRVSDQNVLGGFGSLQTSNRNRMTIYPILYDDANLYYTVSEETGAILYSQNIEDGNSQTICSRVLCNHDSLDCSLHHLYDTEHLNYCAIDDKIYFTTKEGENLVLYEWDVFTDKQQRIYEFPEMIVLTDENGMEVRIENAMQCIERITENVILVQCGNMAYLFNNDFSLQDFFVCGFGVTFSWTERTIFWMQGVDFCCYEIESNAIAQTILEDSFGKPLIPSSYNYYCHKDSLYFTHNNKIMAYNHADKTVDEVIEIDPPFQFVILGDALYYFLEESVYCMNINTNEQSQMVDMTSLPIAQTDTYLIQTSDSQLKLFDYNGKLVH